MAKNYITALRKASFGDRQFRSTVSRQTHGVCSTCTAMSWSGRKTAGMIATKATPKMEAREQRAIVVPVSSAAVPGPAFHRASARPTAAGSPVITGAALSVFGWLNP
jgi:hypothetical protein